VMHGPQAVRLEGGESGAERRELLVGEGHGALHSVQPAHAPARVRQLDAQRRTRQQLLRDRPLDDRGELLERAVCGAGGRIARPAMRALSERPVPAPDSGACQLEKRSRTEIIAQQP
jgi:hypothetical protein